MGLSFKYNISREKTFVNTACMVGGSQQRSLARKFLTVRLSDQYCMRAQQLLTVSCSIILSS
jgi:hypothetical protein